MGQNRWVFSVRGLLGCALLGCTPPLESVVQGDETFAITAEQRAIYEKARARAEAQRNLAGEKAGDLGALKTACEAWREVVQYTRDWQGEGAIGARTLLQRDEKAVCAVYYERFDAQIAQDPSPRAALQPSPTRALLAEREAYLLLVERLVQKNLTIPATIPWEQQEALSAQVEVRPGADGRLPVEPRLIQSSGDASFDAAALLALKPFGPSGQAYLPIPPEALTALRADVLQRGFALEVHGGHQVEVPGKVEAKVLRRLRAPLDRDARAEAMGSSVLIIATVKVDGTVKDVRLIRGVGARLDEATLEAVKRWALMPATVEGKPVESAVRIKVPYYLPELRPGQLGTSIELR